MAVLHQTFTISKSETDAKSVAAYASVWSNVKVYEYYKFNLGVQEFLSGWRGGKVPLPFEGVAGTTHSMYVVKL